MPAIRPPGPAAGQAALPQQAVASALVQATVQPASVSWLQTSYARDSLINGYCGPLHARQPFAPDGMLTTTTTSSQATYRGGHSCMVSNNYLFILRSASMGAQASPGPRAGRAPARARKGEGHRVFILANAHVRMRKS